MQNIEKINSKHEKNREICKQFSKLFMGKLSRQILLPAGEPYKYLRKSPKVPHPSHIRKAIASIDQTTVFHNGQFKKFPSKRQIETAALSTGYSF